MSLVINHVSKSYGAKPVLKDISFAVEPHEFVCILGHSGCGKSTLLNLIAGYLRPDEGTIQVNGMNVSGPSKERGVVFQDHALFPWYSVLDNVAFGPEAQGIPKEDAKRKARQYLKLVGLERYAEQYPSSLSGGMKQRVGIARALAGGPDILLMDEPFGALDILTRDTMRRELQRIWMELRTMVIFITHSISEAIHLGNKVIVMKDGDIAAMYQLDLPFPRSHQDSEFSSLLAEIEAILIEDSVSERIS
ncbi:ABC transporter ATP-binding protein [Paenibacillus sp. HB172176]|uniref:ABC transporter ATP-binding protein n=1 Tax=Paenibacillus sp. HB172176 TaxID=2493690 RepID=UPI00143B71A7|nr:ABC transporter ATP-binding protein [Paenibacillus sp. HB172176]